MHTFDKKKWTPFQIIKEKQKSCEELFAW